MNELKLTDKEKEIFLRALIHYTSYLEKQLRTIPEKDIWDLYKEDLDITNKLLKKFKNEKTNKRED